jgi:hypothetical protein
MTEEFSKEVRALFPNSKKHLRFLREVKRDLKRHSIQKPPKQYKRKKKKKNDN